MVVTGSTWLLYKIYMALTGKLPRKPHNSHKDPVIAMQTL